MPIKELNGNSVTDSEPCSLKSSGVLDPLRLITYFKHLVPSAKEDCNNYFPSC